MKRICCLILVFWIVSICMAIAETPPVKSIQGHIKKLDLDEKIMVVITNSIEVKFRVDKKTKYLFNDLVLDPKTLKHGDEVEILYYIEGKENIAAEVHRIKPGKGK